MHTPETQMNAIVNQALALCSNWVVEDEIEGLHLRDPIDQKIIPAHYGDSHFAAALIILGQLRDDATLVQKGIGLVEAVIKRWPSSQKLVDFHNDFNNFALCIIERRLQTVAPELSQNIRDLILATSDSNHNTVNWQPMRSYVNQSRYEWTGERRYETNADHCIQIVKEVTNKDGGIEDRVPAGQSYNLQYNVSTLATLMLMKQTWRSFEYDLDLGYSFLLENVLPDGDINYLGRGTNQIFAWGPWLYILSCAGNHEELTRAFKFLEPGYENAANSCNILLNEFPGAEKLFWWDYHFCSVYHAHFLFWSVLALSELASQENGNNQIGEQDDAMPTVDGSVTGLSVTSGQSGGAAVFRGRSIYLAEAGPSLCALWDDDETILFKGGLGPWQGAFGKQHSFADLVFLNHFGVVSQKSLSSFKESRVIRKLNMGYSENREALLCPEFGEMHIVFTDDTIKIIVDTEEVSGYFNVPLLAGLTEKYSLSFEVDGRNLRSILSAKSKNQYGWIDVTRSNTMRGKRWEVEISKHKQKNQSLDNCYAV